MHTEFFLGVTKMSWDLTVVTVAEPCEYYDNHFY